MKISGNTILITGGGSGIGRELAHRWHDLGNTVIVAGRTESALAETAAGHANIHPMVLDVADTADIARFAEAVLAAHPALNVLVKLLDTVFDKLDQDTGEAGSTDISFDLTR